MMDRLISALLLLLVVLAPAHAGEPVSTGFFGSTAIGGQDTVSYHDPAVRQSHRALAGDKRYEVHHLGATWRFASQASADRFAADPARYLPQYNGHCANALSSGEGLVTTDGQVWEFFGERLYLFYAERGLQRWRDGDWKAYRTAADVAWKAILAR